MKAVSIKLEGTILTIQFHREYNDEEHIAHLNELHEIMEQGKRTQVHRWVVINDLRVTVLGNAVQRRRQAQWMIEHDDEMRHRTSGIGFVMTSVLVRTTLTAVLWLAPLPAPHGIFATMEECTAWAEARRDMLIDERYLPKRRAAG